MNFSEKDKTFYLTKVGSNCLDKNIVFNTYNDHRMAMATAPLSLVYENVIIENHEVVKKSYPYFWNNLLNAGFALKKAENEN